MVGPFRRGRHRLLLGRDHRPGPGKPIERADFLGQLALIEALRGRLNHAEELAAEAASRPGDDADRPVRAWGAAADVALSCVHLDRNELPAARRWHKRAESALRDRPDKLIDVLASLVAARHSLAEGRARAALETVEPGPAGLVAAGLDRAPDAADRFVGAHRPR